MLDLLKRIPGLFGLRRAGAPEASPAAKPTGRKLGGSADLSADKVKPLRGRGAGRGIIPPSHPKPKKLRHGKR